MIGLRLEPIMLRALGLGAFFVAISPTWRGYAVGAYTTFSEQIANHSTVALAITGLVVFGSFMGLQMTARK